MAIGLGIAGIVLILVLFFSVQSFDGMGHTPVIALSQPSVADNRTATMAVNVINDDDAAYSNSGILVTLPNSTRISWSPGSTGWTFNETSYHNNPLGLSITLVAHQSQANPQTYEIGDRIIIESTAPFATGEWTISLVYYPTGGIMAMVEFVQ
ncbi:MAG TPA: hypothetical protein VMS79_00155 [Methanomassiliicoccales archaeon]|nr:hypothetical protein [Methanomassiliicoccales archaeon]